MNQKIPTKLSTFIWHFIKPYKRQVTALIMIGVVWAFIISARPFILKIIIDKVVKYTPDQGTLLHVIGLTLILYLIAEFTMHIIYRLYDHVYLRMMPALSSDITREMFEYIELHSHRFFQNHFSGMLSNQIREVALSIQEIIEILIDKFFSNTLAVVIASIALANAHLVLGLMLLGWTIFFVLISFYFSKNSLDLSEHLSQTRSSLIGTISDSFINIMTVRLFARNKHELNVMQKKSDALAQASINLDLYNLRVSKIQSYSLCALNTMLLFFLVYAKQRNWVTVGDFALTITLVLTVPEMVWKLSNEFVPFTEALGQCKQALRLITTPHEIEDHPDAKQLAIASGEIEFKNVTFGYSSKKNLFKDLSVCIPGKQKIGLVGISGSGKTTFMQLLTRLYDIQSGNILIDKQDIRNVTQDSLRKSISYIPQDPMLFHRSLRENIMYGNLNATQEEMIEATKKAHAYEFIIGFEQGFETMVGERGIKLSGGQRQRIAIARAFLKNSPILILDEATSSLDSETERFIQDSVQELVQEKTVLVIAHRLSTLLSMDRILVFDRGQIVEDGTHQGLVEFNGIYAKLWSAQSSGFLPEEKEESED